MDQATPPPATGYDPDLLDRLRARLRDDGVDGFLVPHADAFQSEYLPPSDERLARLTGFTGSAGFAIVLADAAAVFVDGRYTLQAANEVDETRFAIVQLAETRPGDWLAQRLAADMTIGFDAWLHTPDQIDTYTKVCHDAGAKLAALEPNPLDALWTNRPAPPATPVEALDDAYTGLSATAKLKALGETIAAQNARAALLTQGESVAWTFNIRADDIPFTPLVLAHALVFNDGHASLFIADERLDDPVRAHLPETVTVLPPERLDGELEALGADGAGVLMDGATVPVRLATHLAQSGARVVNGTDPCTRPKACKTPREIEGVKRAHARDGVALTRFLAWLDAHVPQGGVTEWDAAAHLDALRGEGDLFRGPSFPTISGAGPNGAIVHYRVTPESSRELKSGELYLVDSGGQYLDGTTDVTRTVAIGTPTADMRARFTRVLKGHIALARQVFPKGTAGEQLDLLARQALWEAGLDYDHGTGHGVGTFLGVHEGPQRIAKRGGGAALEVGMVLSNEPGYYKAGAYGIRIENLITVVPAPRPKGAERDLLCFETLTLAPIDLNLVDPDMLSPEETAWLDAYHERVRASLSAHLKAGDRAWLERATRPLTPSR